MAAMMTAIGEVVTGIVGMFSSILGLFTTEPILQFGLGLTVVGFVIGKAKSLKKG